MDVLQKGWRWLLGLGIVLAVLGVLLIFAPALGTLAIDLVVGWFLVVGGVAQVIHAFTVTAWRGFLLELISGVLYGVVGILLLVYPMAGVQALTVLLAAFLAIEGFVRISMALRVRPEQGWVWLMFGGIASVVLAVLIFSQWPSSSLWVIGLLVGINMLFTGWSLIMLAMAAKAREGQT